MKIHFASAALMIVCLGLVARAAEVSPAKTSLTIPVNVANRPAGVLECTVPLGPTSPITAVAFSPDGKTLASGGYREVLLWDLAGAKLATRIPAEGCVGAVALLKDGKTLVVGEGTPWKSGAVRFIDLASGKETFRFAEPKDMVCSIALSPDGKLLAATAAGKVAYVLDVAGQKLVKTLEGHSGRVLHVAFSADGKLLCTSSDDNTAQVWNTADWTPVIKFTESFPVRGSAFHSDGLQVLLAVGGADGSGLRMRKTDAPMFRRPIGLGMAVPLGMTGPTTKTGRVYVPCTDKTVKVFDKAGNQQATLAGHQDWVHAVALSSDETRLASGSADGTIKLWATLDGRPLATLVQLAPRTDEWLIVTALGHFSTSSPAVLRWKAENLVTPVNQVTAKLQDAALVAKTIAGDKVPAPVLK
jgi:WD40 repeat protein